MRPGGWWLAGSVAGSHCRALVSRCLAPGLAAGTPAGTPGAIGSLARGAPATAAHVPPRLHGLLAACSRRGCASSGSPFMSMTRGRSQRGQQLPSSARTARRRPTAGAPGHQAFSSTTSGSSAPPAPSPQGQGGETTKKEMAPPEPQGSRTAPPRPTAGEPGSEGPTATRGAVPNPPPEFTGDELHYVGAPGGWNLALWRYRPEGDESTGPSSSQMPGSGSVGPTESVAGGVAPKRRHPVLLLSGIATNAMGFDISPEVSLARHLRAQGFDTWVVEMRGAGLSYREDAEGRQRDGANPNLAGVAGIGYRTQQPQAAVPRAAEKEGVEGVEGLKGVEVAEGAEGAESAEPAGKRLKGSAGGGGAWVDPASASASAGPGEVLAGAAEDAGRAAAEHVRRQPGEGQGAALDTLATEVTNKLGEASDGEGVASGSPGGGGVPGGAPGVGREERVLQSVERAEQLRLERETVAGDLQRTAQQLRARFDEGSFAPRGAPAEGGRAVGGALSSPALSAQSSGQEVGVPEGDSGGGAQGWWEVRMRLESWLQGALGMLGGAPGEPPAAPALAPGERKALVAVVDGAEELLLACRLGEEEMLRDWGTVRAQAQGLLETLECAIFALDAAEAEAMAKAGDGDTAAAGAVGEGVGEGVGLGVAARPDLALLSLRSSVRQLLQRLQEREAAAAAGGGRQQRGALSWYQRYAGLSLAGKVARFLVGADPESGRDTSSGSAGGAPGEKRSAADSAPAPGAGPSSAAAGALATSGEQQGPGAGEVPSVGVAVSKTVGILRESVVEMAASGSGAAGAAVVSKTVGRLKESVGEIAAAAAASGGRIIPPLPSRTALSSVYAGMVRTIAEAEATVRAVGKYDWDFDTYLLEDLPAVIDYVAAESGAPGGEVMAVGHSMGGILLYSRLAALGPDAKLKGVVTVASSLEYGMSNTSLKLLLPLATPARTLEWAAIPMPLLTRAALPLISQPPFTLAWIGLQMSARNAMDPAHFAQLMRHNFVTIPVRLLLQLESVFLQGGLRSRSGSIAYRKGLKDCRTPVLALAADADLICPPIAVTDTLTAFPPGTAKYMLFGARSSDSSAGPGPSSGEPASEQDAQTGTRAEVSLTAEEESVRYGHYDLLAGHKAPKEVFPAITAFLVECDEGTSADPLNTSAGPLTAAEGASGDSTGVEASPLEMLQNSMSK